MRFLFYLCLPFLVVPLVFANEERNMYAVTKNFEYDDGTVEECVCIGFNPDDIQNGEGRDRRSADGEGQEVNLPSFRIRARLDRTKYSVNKRIDFSGEGYEDCACTPKTRKASRKMRAVSGLGHRLISRRHRRAKERVDPWLATSYEEDEKKERHWKLQNNPNAAQTTNDDTTTKKPIKSSKKTRTKVSKGKTRAERAVDLFFNELEQS